MERYYLILAGITILFLVATYFYAKWYNKYTGTPEYILKKNSELVYEFYCEEKPYTGEKNEIKYKSELEKNYRELKVYDSYSWQNDKNIILTDPIDLDYRLELYKTIKYYHLNTLRAKRFPRLKRAILEQIKILDDLISTVLKRNPKLDSNFIEEVEDSLKELNHYFKDALTLERFESIIFNNSHLKNREGKIIKKELAKFVYFLTSNGFLNFDILNASTVDRYSYMNQFFAHFNLEVTENSGQQINKHIDEIDSDQEIKYRDWLLI